MQAKNQRVVKNLYQRSVQAVVEWLEELVGSEPVSGEFITDIVSFQIVHEDKYTHGVAVVNTEIEQLAWSGRVLVHELPEEQATLTEDQAWDWIEAVEGREY